MGILPDVFWAMTPREFHYLQDGAQWRWERETLTIVSALVGKTPDELLGRGKSYSTLEEAETAGEVV